MFETFKWKVYEIVNNKNALMGVNSNSYMMCCRYILTNEISHMMNVLKFLQYPQPWIVVINQSINKLYA